MFINRTTFEVFIAARGAINVFRRFICNFLETEIKLRHWQIEAIKLLHVECLFITDEQIEIMQLHELAINDLDKRLLAL